ncbi:MAG: YidC/Oxa1 family membrane protein insertase [Clostridia bacterium]|nr:YidC/Oxa1 family membrane protein insertase [Clostridia bacterium]
MTALYDAIAVPFGWLLGQFYNFVGNYFVALVLFALFFKIILLPSAIKQQKSTAKQARLQPKLRRIQERYKGDKNAQQKIQEEQQALYQREGFNPMNQGCLPLLIQMPIILGLYGAVYKPLTYAVRISSTAITTLTELVSKVVSADGGTATNNSRAIEIVIIDNIEKIWDSALEAGIDVSILEQIKEFSGEFNFFGYSLAQNPSFSPLTLLTIIPVLSCLTSLATSFIGHIRSKRNNPAMANNPTMGCMTFGMPLISLYFVTMFPAAIGIYWIINNVYSFLQTLIVGHFYSPEKVIAKQMVEETIARRSKEINTKLIAAKKNEE